MKQLLVILGPTATGKTDLALFLAKKFNGEIISADSRQVYKGLDIGTGKIPSGKKIKKGNGFWEVDDVKIWLYDVANPKRQYTVARYAKNADKVIGEILQKGKLPILVGGSGLYIQAITNGLSNLDIPVDKQLRKDLEKLNVFQLQQKLQTISIKKWQSLNESDRQNSRRLIRAIEFAPFKNISKITQKYNLLKIGLTAPRKILYQRADKRVISRLDQGMINETEKAGLSLKRMKQLGLEYGVLADFLKSEMTKEQLIQTLQGKIHGFIRKQITWFKKEKNINWFDIRKKDYYTEVEKLVSEWYYSWHA